MLTKHLPLVTAPGQSHYAPVPWHGPAPPAGTQGCLGGQTDKAPVPQMLLNATAAIPFTMYSTLPSPPPLPERARLARKPLKHERACGGAGEEQTDSFMGTKPSWLISLGYHGNLCRNL